jgi:hypothetical protein
MPPVLCALACSGVYAYRALLKGLWSPRCRLQTHILVISKLCDALTCTASRWALLTIVPIPTGLHRPRKGLGCYTYCPRLSCVSLFCSVCQSSFRSEQVGNRTPAAMGNGIKMWPPITCPFAGLALPAIIPIFAEPN